MVLVHQSTTGTNATRKKTGAVRSKVVCIVGEVRVRSGGLGRCHPRLILLSRLVSPTKQLSVTYTIQENYSNNHFS